MNVNASFGRRATTRWAVLVACAVVGAVTAGCAPPRFLTPATSTPMTKNRLLEESGGRQEVEVARRMIEAGEYSVVIPRLLHIVYKYPDAEASLDARYWLGVAYYEIQSYRDAIDLFNEYLRLAPDGKHADESAKYAARLLTEYEAQYWTAAKLEKEIGAARAKLAQAPDSFRAKWDLADLLWKRGDYAESARLYDEIVKAHPDYTRDATVLSRLEFQPSGGYLVLTPAEMERRYIEKQPLIIMNQATFHSGQDLYTREARFYVVTGQAMNRSDSTLYGVQVSITLYGFGTMVYDTNTVNIGRLNPGEARAFSVRFQNFDNIDNINRVECVGTFER